MKKLLLASFILVITTASVSAQTEFGVRSGYYNLIKFSEVDNNGTKFRDFEGEGFYVGAFVDISISNRFSIQPEINYIGIPKSLSLSLSLSLSQIQVTTLGKYKIGKKVNIFLGPSIGFFLNPEDDMKNTSLGIAFGVSYDITKKLTIELRGDHGLSKLSGDRVKGYSEVHGWSIGLRYTFD